MIIDLKLLDLLEICTCVCVHVGMFQNLYISLKETNISDALEAVILITIMTVNSFL